MSSFSPASLHMDAKLNLVDPTSGVLSAATVCPTWHLRPYLVFNCSCLFLSHGIIGNPLAPGLKLTSLCIGLCFPLLGH
jgi:hypothetical protein